MPPTGDQVRHTARFAGRFDPAESVFDGLPCRTLLDTADTSVARVYFGLKDKHGTVLENPEDFWAALAAAMPRLLPPGTEAVLLPESSRGANARAAALTGLPAATALKRAKDEVAALAAGLRWTKEEWRSQQVRFAEMGASFEVNRIKPNQRGRYVPLLFRTDGLEALAGRRTLLLDDSLFSGATALAALHAARAAGALPVGVVALFRCSTVPPASIR